MPEEQLQCTVTVTLPTFITGASSSAAGWTPSCQSKAAPPTIEMRWSAPIAWCHLTVGFPRLSRSPDSTSAGGVLANVHLLVDLDADGALRHVPHHARLAVVVLVRHALPVIDSDQMLRGADAFSPPQESVTTSACQEQQFVSLPTRCTAV